MSAAGPACVDCGAGLEPDQEYCLECGARQTAAASPQWRRPLIAAGLALALAAIVFVFAYERMRDDAKQSADGHSAVTRAGASDRATSSGDPRRPGAVRLAARQSP
jgi:predicted amidophosphoribosyltransferase